MFCKFCGVNTGDRPVNFCPACGSPLKPLSSSPTPAGTSAVANNGRRRLLWTALASAGLVATGAAFYVGGCSFANRLDANLGFTLNYPSDEQMLDQFLQSDSAAAVLLGGPYYLGGEQVGLQPIAIAFRRLKAAKVAEATGLNQKIFEQEKRVQEEILLLHAAMIELWNVLQREDVRLLRDGRSLAVLLFADRLKLEALMAVYEGLPESGNAVVNASNGYRRSVLAMVLAGAQAKALARLTAVALPLVGAYEKSSSTVVADAVRTFESRMESISSAAGHLDDAQNKIAMLASLIKQINNAEHFMGLASVQYARKLIPEMQSNLRVVAGNGRATAADLDFMQTYLAYQSRLFEGLEKSLNAVPARYLLTPADLDKVKLSREFSLIMPAYADQGSAAERSMKALSMPTTITRQGLSGALTEGWKGIKTGFQDAKGAVGFGMDGVNSAVKSGFDYAIGKWEGNSDKDIRDTIVDNFSKMEKNLVSGESGAETFESAEGYFDSLEEGGGSAASTAVSTVLGEGNVSWLAGHVGKISVNMFTGFGKGLAKIASTRSSDGEVAEGFLDVGLSFIGGSKVVGKASQLVAGGKSGVKILGQKGLNFLDRVAKNADLGKLKDIGASLLSKRKLTPQDIKKLISNAGEIEANEALKQSLVAANETVNKRFLELVAKAGQTLKDNASSGLKQSYTEFTQEVFKESLEGYKQALITTLGKGFSDYIDNLVANKADDMFKVMVKEYVDRKIIPLQKNVGESEAKAKKPVNAKKDSDCVIFCDEESSKRFTDSVSKKIVEGDRNRVR